MKPSNPMKSMTAVVIGALLVAGPAHAQRSDRADRAESLFKKGKQLLAQKRYPEACTAFEDSDRLDSGIGAKLNVARCYQEWGKLATAWRWFTDAERMAVKANDNRASQIRVLVDELDQSVPRLTVSAPKNMNLDRVVVKLDGSELAHAKLGVELRVDPGPHQIDTIVDGVKRSKTIPVERGGSAEVTLELPSAAVADTDQPAREPREPRDEYDPEQRQRRFRTIAGLSIAGGGLALAGFAGLMTLRARSNYDYAIDTHCMGATNMCDDIGLDSTRGARRRANISTVLTIGGVAAIAGGITLVILARKSSTESPRPGADALYLAPELTGDGGTLVLGGAF